jgi:hypothetical protein
MSTGRTWLALYPTSILALGDLTTGLRDSVLAELSSSTADVYGSSGTIGGTKAAWTYGAPTISLSATVKGVTGDGERLTATAAGDGWTAIPFANTGGVAYEIGARRNFYPSDVSTSTIDGLPAYTEATEAVGELGAPSAVTDTGTGLRFTITTLAKTVWTGAQTRPVKVWKATPSSGVLATAVVDGVAEYDGAGGIRVTITGYLGQAQATASLTAADYLILVLGVTVAPPGGVIGVSAYWFMGTITTGVFTNAAATAFIPWGSWLSTFAVEHDTGTGKHTTVNGDGFNYNAGAGRNGTYQVDAYEIATGLIGFRQNGGANQAGTFTAAAAAEPANVRTTGGISGTYAEILVPLRFPPDQAIIVNSLSAVVWLFNAAPTEYFTIELIERPAQLFSGSITVRATWTMGKPAAATWGTVVPTAGPGFPWTLPAPATPDVIRYWRIRFYEPNPGNSRIAALFGTAAAAKVSPLPY